MRLNELAEHVKEHGMRRYAVKRGFALPLALGASAVAAATHGHNTYRDARDKLDRASHEQLAPDVARKKLAMPNFGSYGGQMAFPGMGGGGTPPGGGGSGGGGGGGGLGGMAGSLASGMGSIAGAPMAGAASGISEKIKQMIVGRQFGENKDPAHLLGTAAIGSFGKGLGDLGIQLLQDIAAKAMAAAGNVGQNAARQAILQQLKQEDAVLSNADDKVLMEAYHTMTRFAPVLSTDKNAVRSFLRQAVMSGNGADYSTIKHLADSERAVTDTGQSRR